MCWLKLQRELAIDEKEIILFVQHILSSEILPLSDQEYLVDLISARSLLRERIKSLSGQEMVSIWEKIFDAPIVVPVSSRPEDELA